MALAGSGIAAGPEIAIFDTDGRELPLGVEGEIVIRGANVTAGYEGNPAANAAGFARGWFRTGDLASGDAGGGFRLIGRREGDLIKTGGFRVGAGEVEEALLEHPAVAEVAVTGEPDLDLGQRIVAWVVPAAGGEARAEELTEHVTQLLSAHKRPREYRFRDSLPRNAVGKVQKRRLGG